MQGQFDLWSVSTPARLHIDKSSLQMLQLSHCFAANYKKAALTKDPIERLKIVAAGILGGTYYSMAILKAKAPLNPILGETLQGELMDGTKFYGEQICHHPPISAFQMIGPENLYTYNSNAQYKGWLSGPNSFKGCKISKNVINFSDGGLLQYIEPGLSIDKLIVGNEKIACMLGKAVIKDFINKMELEIDYEPQTKKGMMGKMTSMFKSKDQPKDYFTVQIF